MYLNPILNVFLEFMRFSSFALCILFNGMLLRMIFMSRHKDLGTYRYLLLVFVLSDVINGTAHVLTMPIPEIYKNAFVMGGHGWWTSRSGLCFYPIAFSLAFPCLCFNFLYRLVAVKYPFSIDSFKTFPVISVLFSIAMLNCAAWSGITRYIGFDNPDSHGYVYGLFTGNVSFPTQLRYDLTDIDDYIVVVYWEGNTGHKPAIIGSAILGMTGEIGYDFMAYASIGIVRHLRSTPHMSERSQQMHMQLFRALVLQALTPLITLYLPIGLSGFLPFFGAELPLFSVLTPPFCAMHPVFDAIIMLATVSQFRKTLINWVLCRNDQNMSRVLIFESEERKESRREENGSRRRWSLPIY